MFTDNETIKRTNEILESISQLKINKNNFYLETTTEYMLLLAEDIDGLNYGIDTMKEIFTQTFDNYLSNKQFEDFVKIRPFKILS